MCTCKIIYIWQLYQVSIRGLSEQSFMPCSLKKHVVTPTTEVVDCDVLISPKEMVARGLVSQQKQDLICSTSVWQTGLAASRHIALPDYSNIIAWCAG